LGWLVETKRLARICAQRLITEYVPFVRSAVVEGPRRLYTNESVSPTSWRRPSDVQTPSPSLRLLLVLCNATEWPLGGNDDKSVLSSRILLDLINNGLFESLHKALTNVVCCCVHTSSFRSTELATKHRFISPSPGQGLPVEAEGGQGHQPGPTRARLPRAAAFSKHRVHGIVLHGFAAIHAERPVRSSAGATPPRLGA
jgi:hypothetical protein